MRVKLVSLVVVVASLFANITSAQNVKQKEEVIILKKGNNDKQVTIKIDGDKMTINGEPVSDSIKNSFLQENGGQIKTMKVIVNGDKMTINGKPVSDSIKNSFLQENGGQIKTMKVIVNGEKMTINGNPSSETPKIFEEKIIKGENKLTKIVIVKGDSITINEEPIDASERNIKVIKNGKTIITNDFNNLGKKEIRINNNQNFNLPDEFQMRIAQPRMMLGVVIGSVEKGLIIKEVVPESAAAQAGLKVDDIITKFNGTALKEPKQLVDSVQNKKPGDLITLKVIKAGEKKETSLSVKFNKQNASNQVRLFVEGEGPNDDGAIIEKDIQRQLHKLDLGNGMPKKRIYMQRMPMNEKLGDFKFQKPLLGIQVQETKDSSGVIVLKVMEGFLAESSGVKVNDVITAVDGEKIADIQSATRILEGIKEKNNFQLKVKRNGTFINIDVKKQVKLRKAVL